MGRALERKPEAGAQDLPRFRYLIIVLLPGQRKGPTARPLQSVGGLAHKLG
jgi:hypothetical protein